MVFCTSCGASGGSGRFCPACGADLSTAGKEGKPSGQKPQMPMPKQPKMAANARRKEFKKNNYNAETKPIVEGLKKLYREKILPIEQMFSFEEFHSPSLTDTDFEAKPMVLLIGQYSTGKTTFIRYLLERDFPGCRIGPEPTTDRFVAVMHGLERVTPGNALAADADKPFTALTKFGMAFLNKFEASTCLSPILEKITLIDTPGVLSGEKQRIGRTYDFASVVEWFAERADRILLLFDAHKLDISDEFKSAIGSLRGHDDKIRVVLNKADIPTQKLMRVYGALMWSLGKVIRTPEVLRVYIGSFWDQPLNNTENAKLLQAEQNDLLADLRSLPRNSAIRKINELVKRARMAKVHTYIIAHLRNQFGWFGKEKTQEKLLHGLLTEFKKVQQKHNLPMGDFPHVARFRETLTRFQINKFPKLPEKMMEEMEQVLSVDIPRLMKQLPGQDMKTVHEAQMQDTHANPFVIDPEKRAVGGQWTIDNSMKAEYDNAFHLLPVKAGRVSGDACKDTLMGSGLPLRELQKLWDLADCDRDGSLDSDEFAVAMYLIESYQNGIVTEMPNTLPPPLIPPTKRHLFDFE